MNKIVKVLLLTLGGIAALILIGAGIFFWILKNKEQQAKSDAIAFSKICDAITDIEEQPLLVFEQFDPSETAAVHFYLLRNNSILKDTLLKNEVPKESENHYCSIAIPFEKFKKSDTIIVRTQSNLFFSLSGFSHYAYLHYGMFGYVGSYDCRFSNDYTVNGKAGHGTLSKSDAIKKDLLLEFKTTPSHE